MLGNRSRAYSVPNCGRDHRNVPSVVYDVARTAYNIGPLLGKGGFAKCYLAYSDRQEFALKVISKNSVRKVSYMNKIRKEVDTHFGLRHPNIVALYDTFEDRENIYMLLEYCPNRTLAEYIESSLERRIKESAAVVILKQLLKAVRYLHTERRILHRDIKPGNILLSRENTVKLADFGFCCSIAELEKRKTYTVCGTPNYVPAEVLDRMGHSVYSESWSIACTFYCMLFGRPPFHSDCQEVTYARIRKCCYVFPSGYNVSRTSKDFIARTLVCNRYDRPTSEEMLTHPLFSNFNRCVSYANGLNNNRSSSRCSRISTDFSSTDYHDSLPIGKKYHKSGLIDSGLGSGGDLCGLSAANTNDTCAENVALSQKSDLRIVLQHYMTLLDECTDSFDPVYLSPINVDLCRSFVAKWVDYTNKFGFGVTLKDGTRSLLLNDNSAIATSHLNSRLLFCGNQFCRNVEEWSSVESVKDPAIAEKFNFLSFLRTYMDRELYSFVEIGLSANHFRPEVNRSSRLSSFISTTSTNRSITRMPRTRNDDYYEEPTSTTASLCESRDYRSAFIANAEYSDGRALRRCGSVAPAESLFSHSVVGSLLPLTYLVDAWKSPMGILMLLSDGTCQLNIAESRYKVVICRCPQFGSQDFKQSKIRIFIITPEHDTFGYEIATSYDLNRAEPSDEIIKQLNLMKHALKQYQVAKLSSSSRDINDNALYDNDGQCNEQIPVYARCATKHVTVDSTADRPVHLRSTNC